MSRKVAPQAQSQTDEPLSSKERILDAAEALFGEHGYNDTTFKKIAEQAGVAYGLIPHYFKNKENLYVSSSIHVLDIIQERLRAALVDAPDGLTAVSRWVSTYLDCSVDPNLNFRILVRCSPYNDVKTLINQDDVTRAFEALVDMLANCLAEGMRDGTVIDGEPHRMGHTIFATIVGSVRTRLISTYCPDNFYDSVIRFINRSIAVNQNPT